MSVPVSKLYGPTQPPPVDVYVSSYESPNIWRIEAGSGYVTVVSSAGQGPLAVDGAGGVYLPSGPDGVIKVATGGGSSTHLAAGIFTLSLAADAVGNVYILTEDGTGVVKVPAGGGKPKILWQGTGGWLVAVDEGENVYVLGLSPVTVVKVPPSGASPTVFDLSAIFPPSSTPAFAVDPAGQNLYVSRFDPNDVDVHGVPLHTTIAKVPLNGDPHTTFGTGVRGVGLAADAGGQVYIADSLNDRVVMLSDQGSGRQLTIAHVTGAYGVAVPAAGLHRWQPPDLMGKLFGAAAADGGGWIVIGDRFIPVPPRSPVNGFLVEAAMRYRTAGINSAELGAQLRSLR